MDTPLDEHPPTLPQKPRRPRILVVDDSPSNLMALGASLKDEYDITVATNGDDALAAVARQPPDLVLLDIVMPGIDGYEVCRRIKSAPETRRIPVIFITAKDDEAAEVLGLETGAVDYLTKPFRMPIVRARVRTHIDLKQKSDFLETLSYRDGLTGLLKRRRFDEVMQREWSRAQRSTRSISLVMVDIDYFKHYNDCYGHVIGDQCLRSVAGELERSFRRACDFVARYGGEEFAIVLTESDADAAWAAAENARERIEALAIAHAESPSHGRVTISLGVVSAVPTADAALAAFIVAADTALYQAKDRGRNRSVRAVYVPGVETAPGQ